MEPLTIQRVDVDWENESAEIVAELPDRSVSELEFITLADRAVGDKVQLEIASGVLTLSGPVKQLLAQRINGTRSFLLGSENHCFQLDLPPVEIASIASSESDGRPIVKVECTGLLPGFAVQVKTRSQAGANKHLPKVGKPSETKNGAAISIGLSQTDAVIEYQLFVVNADGSRTRTVVFTQTKGQLDARVRVVAEESPTARYESQDPQSSTPGLSQLVLSDDDFISHNERLSGESVASSVAVDWRTKDVKLTVEKEATACRVVVQDESPVAAFALPQASVTGAKVVLAGMPEDWSAALTPGTRSVWGRFQVGDGEACFRMDIPAVEIVGASVKESSPGRGPTVTLTLQNLLPGFDVVYAESLSGAETADVLRTKERILTRSTATLPRIAAAALGDEGGQVELSVELPLLGEEETVSWLLAVCNFDGSRTRTLRLTQRGASIQGSARSVRDALPAPVDEALQVPDVEFLEAAEAVKLVAGVGLAPVLFDMDRFQELDMESHEQLLIQRQGTPAGQRLAKGSRLLLGVRLDGGPLGIHYRQGRVPLTASMPLVTGSPDFAPIQRGDIEDASGPRRRQPRMHAAPASGSGELLAAPAWGEDPDATDDTPEEVGSSSLSSIHADPGVNIDPAADADETARGALLNVLVGEVEARLQTGDYLGPIGDAIRRVQADLEAAAMTELYDGTPATLPLDTVTEGLGVELTPDQQAQAREAWSEHMRGRTHPALADANGNGAVCDDIVLWIVAWLNQSKLYHPAAHAKLSSNAEGNTTLLLRSRPGSPNWMAAAQSSQQTAPHLPAPKDNEPDEREVEVETPRGEPTVAQRTGPDFVRLPEELIDKRAAEVQSSLAEIGLRIDSEGKQLFANDKVVGTRPDPGAWLRPDRRVALAIKRMVPDVSKSPAGAAAKALSKKELEPIAAEQKVRFRADDVVVDQRPAAGEYVARDTKVELTLKRRVPKIVGRRAEEAVQLLKEGDFQASGPKDTQGTDVVASQTPAAGELADLGSPVRLDRVETIVPDLKGSSLANAKSLASALSELKKKNLGMEIVQPQTKYAGAKVLDQSPAFGQRIDRSKEKVKVALVVPVPTVSNRTPLRDAVKAIERRDIAVDYTSSKRRDNDYVMDVNIGSGVKRYRAGGTTYIQPRDQVVLTVGRKVPNVAKRPWSDAVRSLAGEDLATSQPLGEGTHVFSTEPAGGSLVDLRRSVKVYAGIEIPRVRGNTLDVARRKLAALELSIDSGAPREVETPNPSLFGAIYVEDAAAAQTPRAGEIVRKGSIRSVKLRLIRYIEPMTTVPNVIDLAVNKARERLADRELKMNVLTVRAQLTNNQGLDGVQTVYLQDPNAGKRVKKESTVNVRVTQWKYVEPAKQLVTYGIFPGSRSADFDDAIWVVTLAPDRRTASVRVMRAARGQGSVIPVRLVDDKSQFMGERCFTYAAQGRAPFAQLRLPVDGNGFGQLNIDGVWIFAQPKGLRFQTRPPSF